MAFDLIDLPYGDDALAPAISSETLSFHHGKHHKTYVDKMNAAIAGTAHDDATLEAVVADARGSNAGLVQQRSANLEPRVLLALA